MLMTLEYTSHLLSVCKCIVHVCLSVCVVLTHTLCASSSLVSRRGGGRGGGRSKSGSQAGSDESHGSSSDPEFADDGRAMNVSVKPVHCR